MPGCFHDGLALIEERTGWPSLGVVPWLPETARLPAEDSLGLTDGAARDGTLVVAVPALPRIANFDDLDPLGLEPGVSVRIVRPGEPIPAEAELVLIPGSKATIADLQFVQEQGWDIDIGAHRRRGGSVLGLCGGYQMLGRRIADPAGIGRRAGARSPGLGLLDVETVMGGDKITVPVARAAYGKRRGGDGLRDPSRPDDRAGLRATVPRLASTGGRTGRAPPTGGSRAPMSTASSRATGSGARFCGPGRGGVGAALRTRGRGGARCAGRASRAARRHRPAARDRRRHAKAMTSTAGDRREDRTASAQAAR